MVTQAIAMTDSPDATEEANDDAIRTRNPFTLAAKDLLRHYFFQYWQNTGKFPPFNGVHKRVHTTDWFMDGPYECPGDLVMLALYNRCKGEIS